MARFSSLVLLGAAAVSASPLAARQETATVTVTTTASAEIPTSTAWNAGAVNEITVHPSCNATQARAIRGGINDALAVSRQARDHILRWGNSSEIYQKYFGHAPTGEPIGWFTKMVDGDKSGIVFRCDNPDGNCANEGWAGHWRGSNATSETVICEPSYTLRKPLEQMCMFGYDVANGGGKVYWASDIVHRLLHVPAIGEGIVEHYAGANEYPGVIDLAKTLPDEAVRNSATYQLFALEVYAHDVSVPGVGCPGHYTGTASAGDSHGAPASSTAAASATAVASSAPSAAATTAPAAPAASCTPHEDHWHCPAGVPEPPNPPA